jgi:protein TonB
MVHGVAILALLSLGGKVAPISRATHDTTLFIPTDLLDVIKLAEPDRGGGGGDRSPTPASLGKLAPFAPQQFAPPVVVNRAVDPELEVPPTLLGPPQVILPSPNLNVWGDSHGAPGPPSNGPGSGDGIGSGRGGGDGPGDGRGAGPGKDSGFSNPTIHVVTGASPPVVIFQVEPEFTDAARKAKYQGTVEVSIIVDADGTVRDARVVRAAGLGLDERALDAVKQWKFKPGMKDGHAVPVYAQINVTFRLL